MKTKWLVSSSRWNPIRSHIHEFCETFRRSKGFLFVLSRYDSIAFRHFAKTLLMNFDDKYYLEQKCRLRCHRWKCFGKLCLTDCIMFFWIMKDIVRFMLKIVTLLVVVKISFPRHPLFRLGFNYLPLQSTQLRFPLERRFQSTTFQMRCQR